MWQRLIQFKGEKAAGRCRILRNVKLHNLYSHLILLAFDISMHTVVGFRLHHFLGHVHNQSCAICIPYKFRTYIIFI